MINEKFEEKDLDKLDLEMLENYAQETGITISKQDFLKCKQAGEQGLRLLYYKMLNFPENKSEWVVELNVLPEKPIITLVNSKYKKDEKEKINPFKKLHYATSHLSHFEELNLLLGLYGKHYLPIKKARWYQLIGGVLQKKIRLGEKYTDTRINCIFPLPTEQGKNDLIYLFKSILSQVKKSAEHNFSIEEPVSYHPEQLVGKVIEIMIDNPNGTKPKKIKAKHENRGYFNSDFIEIDEANLLFFSKDEQIKQAREYISKALNPIDRNEIVKKLVNDLPEERVAYNPKCTMSIYFQPKKLEEDLMSQGFLRRFLIPVGSIEPFLNYGNGEDFKKKISNPEFSKVEKKEALINYLSKVRDNLKNTEFIFSEQAREKLNFYLEFLIAEGQAHSERIANFVKLFKWTIQDYLIRMSCIIAGSYFQNVVNENFVALAYMDLVEFLQCHFDFISEWLLGNFDYGIAWKGADYKAKQCLEFLYVKNCFSAETSTISIAQFENYIMGTYEIKDTRARQKLAEFRKNGWVESKQIFQGDTKVWLNFIPQIENLTFQGDKANKGYNLYESVYSAINSILTTMPPLSPMLPSIEKIGSKEPEEEENGN
ncbi:MAG: hypothetical protein NT076_01260 [Candidatus Pacearchaeota archaeon]|nr:hypothetical protein [Candidatus Pacearchaeota archaeon]